MDLDIDLGAFVDPLSYLPVGLWAWTLQIVPTAIGIWTERSHQRLARGAYLFSLTARILALLVINGIALTAVNYLVFTHDPASPTPAIDGVTTTLALMSVLSIIANILLIRPLVWRLRDAGIGKNWAYFAVLPYLDFLMFVGLIFMPPSKTGIEPRATALSQME